MNFITKIFITTKFVDTQSMNLKYNMQISVGGNTAP